MQGMRDRFRLAGVFRRWTAGEAGMGDAITAMIVLPFMMAMIFVLIEVGYNFRYRASVDAITQDAARGVSQDGANYWSATTTLGSEYAESDGSGRNGWSRWGTERLLELCGTRGERCDPADPAPYMNCDPASPQASPGALVSCTAYFPYRPLATFTATNPVFNLGFGDLWNRPIETTVRSRTVVGTGA